MGTRQRPAVQCCKAAPGPLSQGDRRIRRLGQDVFGYQLGHLLVRNDGDSAGDTHMGVVVDDDFDWHHPGDTFDTRLAVPFHEIVIYEAHVKGLTALHPDVPEDRRGSYAAVAHPSVVAHLKSLGVTAVELMPVHQLVHDERLLGQGLRNHWGYNTKGFFAPHNDYASTVDPGEHVREFKSMVKELHRNGLEVILDVVYKHTAEGSNLGPTLSFRGIDNDAYYRLQEGNKELYLDYTGTGSSLNVRQPHSL